MGRDNICRPSSKVNPGRRAGDLTRRSRANSLRAEPLNPELVNAYEISDRFGIEHGCRYQGVQLLPLQPYPRRHLSGQEEHQSGDGEAGAGRGI